MGKKLSNEEVEDLKTRFVVYRSIEKRHRRVGRKRQFRMMFLSALVQWWDYEGTR